MAQQDKKFFFLRTGYCLSVRNELAQLDTLYFQNSSLAVLDTLRSFPVLYNLSKKELYQKILSDIANGNTGTVHPDAYKAYAQNFRHAVNGVFSDNEKYADLQAQFNANVSRFAAYKAYWLTEQLKQYHQESPDNFDNIGKAIINTFNRYQAAEYNTAVARTRTAKQWTDFTSDPTANMLYPNLKWLPSRSANRREEHIPFYGLVLPKTDEFWQHNQPGNLWNCKCDWEETDEQPSSYIPKDIYAKGLEGNPAQTGQIFTDKASYINRAGKKVESYALKITRKDNLDWAMETLKGKKIRNEEFNRDITFTGRGIKDYINQPIDNPILKNEAIRTIPKLLKKAKYLGYSDYKASNTIRHSHIFEITLANKKQWIIIHEYANNDIAFYSISNNQNVLIGIKKENTQPLE